MNSWRLSSHFWPTAVRNLMPSNHSSSVSCTSRAKACRCFTGARHDLAEARVLGLLQPRDDRVGEGVFGELAHGAPPREGPSVLSKSAMRLVTFRTGREGNAAHRRAIDGDRSLDLQAATVASTRHFAAAKRARHRRGRPGRPRPRRRALEAPAARGAVHARRRDAARADPAAAADARLPVLREAPAAGLRAPWQSCAAPRRASRRSGTSGRSSTTRTASRVRHGRRRALAGAIASAWTSSSNSAATSASPARTSRKERAREHIFGYTIFNDFSARDEQTKEMPGQLGPGKGKDFDNGNAMGPCLVTADEIGDPYRLDMMVRVNGEEWGRGNSRDMHWKFEDCIAHVVALGDAPSRASSSAPARSATAAASSTCASSSPATSSSSRSRRSAYSGTGSCGERQLFEGALLQVVVEAPALDLLHHLVELRARDRLVDEALAAGELRLKSHLWSRP